MRADRSVLVTTITLLAACSPSSSTSSSTPSGAPVPARSTTSAITPADLRVRLFAVAHDSMMGRQPGSEGDYKAAEYIAAELKRVGLQPAGENGSYFQTVPFYRARVDAQSRITAGGAVLVPGEDWAPANFGVAFRPIENAATIFGGTMADSSRWPAADAIAGKVVVMSVVTADGRRQLGRLGPVVSNPRFRRAAAIAVVALDLARAPLAALLRDGALVVDTIHNRTLPPTLLITPRAATAMLGSPVESAVPGAAGVTLIGHIALAHVAVPFAARNVVAVLPGSDSQLRGEYISLSAHNDHVGFNHAPVDHDSIRAYLRVKRPMGADTPDSPITTPEQASAIRQILDSLRRTRAPRADSIMNGADDDGTGTVALLEIAEELGSRPTRPRRSILFVSHTGEEYGLIGSAWYTDHATVPTDSIVGEIDMDMIGRGTKGDLPEGGPEYLEVIGAKRLSVEFGTTLEAVNARQPIPFRFNYAFDAPGHPLQYYCRADHYSYARYGIPSVALSRGEHLDYHQVTDEAQYIDYEDLARVTMLVHDAALELANRDRRPALDHPKGDPHAPCRQ